MSMLDEFLGYSQVLMAEEDKYKIAFNTSRGTYSLNRMSFGLKKTGATFQRAMDHDFEDLIGKFMAAYQDALIVYSKLRELHFKQLKEVFSICSMFEIPLNLKKCMFIVIIRMIVRTYCLR